MRSIRTSAALLGVVLVLAACGAGGPDEAEPPVEAPATAPAAAADATTDAATDAATDTPAGVVPAALQFSAPLVGGGELDAASLAGKPTLFWFWAPT